MADPYDPKTPNPAFIKMPFRDLPLGARFKYDDKTQFTTDLYVVLSQAGPGTVAHVVPVGSNKNFQGIYSAFDDERERLTREVWALKE